MPFPGVSYRDLRFRLFAALVAALTVIGATPPARAIVIYGEEPADQTGIYDRFNVGSYPTAPVPNPTFIGAAFDLSAVGWSATNSSQSVTLISSQYFLGAAHFKPAIGSSVLFRGTDGIVYSATVDSYHTLTYSGSGGAQVSDVAIGRLVSAVPVAVNPMPIFYMGTTNVNSASSFDRYVGLSLYNYGWTARMGTNVLEDFTEYRLSPSGPNTNVGLYYDYDAVNGETLLEGGDSGSPTFAYRNGVFGLIGAHSGVDTPHGISVDTFLGYTPYVNQINAIMASDGQALTFAVVPEPGTLLFGFLVVGACGLGRFRKLKALQV